MKTYDRRGWEQVMVQTFEVHIYRRGNVGMIVRFDDGNPEPSVVDYTVWGQPVEAEVRYDSYEEAAAVAEKIKRVTCPSSEVH